MKGNNDCETLFTWCAPKACHFMIIKFWTLPLPHPLSKAGPRTTWTVVVNAVLNWLCFNLVVPISSVQFSCSVVSDSLWPHGLQHTRPPCPSPTPRIYPNFCPLSQWCHPTISSSVIPFSSCLQSFLASRYFPVSQFFPSCDQSIGVSASASVHPMNIYGNPDFL